MIKVVEDDNIEVTGWIINNKWWVIMIQISIKIMATLLLIMGIFWTLLPCSFGLHNFVKSHSPLLGLIAKMSWIVLLGAHFLLMYLLWFQSTNYWWLLLLIAAHILFFVLFGRDLGAS